MGLLRTVTSVSAGNDGTATWANEVFNDIGSIINYRLVYTQTYADPLTFDLNNSGIQLVTLTGNAVLNTPSNVVDGQTFCLIFKQGGSGGYTPTWWSGIVWPSGSAPTLASVVGHYDMFCFTKIGSQYLATFSGFDIG